MRKQAISFVLAMSLILILAGFAAADQPDNSGNPGAIWTTTYDCNSPQDANLYVIGEHVYIHAEGFDSNTLYDWSITGLPGGASCDPDEVVISGTQTTDSNGAFCFDAYIIENNDCGEYKAAFDGKHDNYHVVPEFGTTVGILTALGALGVFFLVRRK